MKIILLLSFAISSIAMASGSYDVICTENRTEKNAKYAPIRYHFHQGEEWEVTLFKVAGIDQKKAFDAIVKDNPLKLDAWDVQNILTRKNELNFNLCAVDEDKMDENGECAKGPNATTAKLNNRAGKNQHGTKVYYITQTMTRKDGTTAVLNINQWGESDSGDEFTGTLKVETTEAGWSKLGDMAVSCQVTTP